MKLHLNYEDNVHNHFEEYRYQHNDLMLTVVHGGGGNMIWTCFNATKARHPAVVEITFFWDREYEECV